MVVVAAAVRDVADAVVHKIVEHAVVEAGPGVPGLAGIDFCERLIGAAFVDLVAPVRGEIAVAIRPGVHLDIRMLRVFPVGDLVEVHELMPRRQFAQDFARIQGEGAIPGVAEQVHAVGLPVPGLPGGRVGAWTVSEGPQPLARLRLEVIEYGAVVRVVKFLVYDEDARVGVVFADDFRHFGHGLDEDPAIGIAPVAFTAAAVTALEPHEVEEGAGPELFFTLFEHACPRLGNGQTDKTLASDGLGGFPGLGNGAVGDVGIAVRQRHQTVGHDKVVHGSGSGLKRVGAGQRVIQDNALGLFGGPRAVFPQAECGAALAILRAADFESGRGPHVKRVGYADRPVIKGCLAENLAGGVETAAIVNARGQQCAARARWKQVEYKPLRSRGEGRQWRDALSLHGVAQGRMVLRAAQKDGERGGAGGCGVPDLHGRHARLGQAFLKQARDALLDGAGRLPRLDGHVAVRRAPGDRTDKKTNSDDGNNPAASHANHTPVFSRHSDVPDSRMEPPNVVKRRDSRGESHLRQPYHNRGHAVAPMTAAPACPRVRTVSVGYSLVGLLHTSQILILDTMSNSHIGAQRPSVKMVSHMCCRWLTSS